MPESRDYIVTQTREVQVTANTEVDAARLADAAFEHGQNADSAIKAPHGPKDTWGNTTSRIKTTEIIVKRVR